MKRLLKVSSFTALLTLIKMLCGFLVAKVVAVYTGPTGLAMLGQIQGVVGTINGIVNAPVGSGVIRYTAENNTEGIEQCVPWWRASVQWVMLLLLIVVPIAICLSNEISTWLFNEPKYAWIIVITSAALPITALGTLTISVINGHQRYKRFVFLGAVSTVISSLVMVCLVVFYNVTGALIAASIQAALIGCVVIVLSVREPWFKLKYWWGETGNKERKAIGGYVLMAVTSSLTGPIALIAIRSILVEQVGWDEAGYWQAVWKISEVYLTVITVALSTYFLPKLASLKTSQLIKKEINSATCLIVPIVSVIAVLIYLTRDISIYILFSSDFRQSRDLFLVQLAGDVIKISSWLYAYPMLSKGKVKLFVCSEIIFSFVFVLCSYVLILEYGTPGANISYLLTYSLYFIWVRLSFNKIIS